MRKLVVAVIVAFGAGVGGLLLVQHFQRSAPQAAQVAPQLLWDFTGPYTQPDLPQSLKDKITEQIWPITHTSDKVIFTSEVRGAFYPGAAAGSQTAVAATQYSQERSEAEGPWSFLIIQTDDNLELFQNPYGTAVLRAFRPEGATADLLLSDADGGEQGEDRHFERVISVASHSIQLVRSIGLADISDCAGIAPHGNVADRIYFTSTVHGSIAAISREHFYRNCTTRTFQPLKSDLEDVEQLLLTFPATPQ